jgi:phosphatidylserine/phosphatidylglycerophosphate/cardiolipin synthase-like enzyme
MFGNIIGVPVNCNLVIKELTKDLPEDASSKLKLWVGSWRKGVSWNHAKIIAVDGKYLWTGGHNFCDSHYLKTNPVCDLGLELEGGVANDAHRYVRNCFIVSIFRPMFASHTNMAFYFYFY